MQIYQRDQSIFRILHQKEQQNPPKNPNPTAKTLHNAPKMYFIREKEDYKASLNTEYVMSSQKQVPAGTGGIHPSPGQPQE